MTEKLKIPKFSRVEVVSITDKGERIITRSICLQRDIEVEISMFDKMSILDSEKRPASDTIRLTETWYGAR